MRWLALLTLLLTGCTVLPPAPESLLRSDWNHLESRLEKAPAPLRQALEEEAFDRLNEQAALTPSAQPSPAADTKVLTRLIVDSRQPLLRPDQRFKQTFQLIKNTQQNETAAEAYARALTGYLLQPGFHRRQPIYTRYFQERYPGMPAPSSTDAVPFLIADRHEGTRLLWLDPHRVRAIHLLFAGSGPQIASRYGHVALRLLISPEGRFDDKAADSNLYEHIVLGYMAHIDEFELNTVKALMGDYKAYLFASPFMDTYRNYAITEFREIFSLPLVLTQIQREEMVRELSEIHWRFSGDYQFFTRNCATLLQQALRVLMPGFKSQPTLEDDYMRPDRFFEAIRKTPLVVSGKLDSLEAAEQQGFYFSSTRPYYEKALNVVKAAMKGASFDDIDGYLQRFPGERMKEIVDNTAYFDMLASDSYHLEAQILLEELAMVRSERRLIAESSRYFNDLDIDKMSEKIKPQLNEDEWVLYETFFLSKIRMITRPVPRLAGIPDNTDNLPTVTFNRDGHTDAVRAQLSDILARVNPDGRKQWQRIIASAQILEDTIENILILRGLRNEDQ